MIFLIFNIGVLILFHLIISLIAILLSCMSFNAIILMYPQSFNLHLRENRKKLKAMNIFAVITAMVVAPFYLLAMIMTYKYEDFGSLFFLSIPFLAFAIAGLISLRNKISKEPKQMNLKF